jgi:NTE family protein
VATALVLSAGGLWAAWEVGAWKVLRDCCKPDLVVGASAGALNGWAIAGDCTCEELAQEWLDPRTANLMRRGIHMTGFFKPDVLYEKARELHARFHPKRAYGLTLVELPRLQSRLICHPDVTWQHLAAACAIPLGFPPMLIDGKRYVDGGLRGALPLWAAERMGATKVIALNVLNTPLFELLRFTTRPLRPSAAMEVRTLEPSERLGSLRDALVWSQANIRRWLELGERDAKRALPSITM